MKNLYNKGKYSFDSGSSNYLHKLGKQRWRRHAALTIAEELEQHALTGRRVRFKTKKKPFIVRFIVESFFGKSKYWARYSSLKNVQDAMMRPHVIDAQIIDKLPYRK